MGAAFLLLISFAVILAGALVFTNAVEWLGHRLDMGEGATGSILTAVGTAMPETLIPVVAIIGGGEGSEDVAIGAIIALVMIVAIYLLPVIIASTRSVNNTAAIAVVNIFLGWTFFGWIAALVWALAEPDSDRCKREREDFLRALREGLSLGDTPSARMAQGRAPCPHCAELVKRAANVCPFCRRDIPVSALSAS